MLSFITAFLARYTQRSLEIGRSTIEGSVYCRHAFQTDNLTKEIKPTDKAGLEDHLSRIAE